MKLISLFLLVLFLNPLKLFAKTDLYIRSAMEASYMVLVPRVGSGSGVAVYQNENGSLIMTNDHVCQLTRGITMLSHETDKSKPINTLPIQVMNSRGDIFKAVVVKTSNLERLKKGTQGSDLCIVEIKERVPTLEIDSSDQEIGSKVFNVSAPLGIFPVIFDGFLGPVESRRGGNMKSIQVVTLAINHGSSGSGVFSYENGKVVGIAFAIISADEGTNATVVALMVPGNQAKDFLNSYLEKK